MIKQLLALNAISLKSIPLRLANATISIISIACVSAVILSVLTLSDGMQKTMAKSGLANTLLVMRNGASSELLSVMFPIEVNILTSHPQVLRDAQNHAIYSAEMFVSTQYHQADGTSVGLALRGVGSNTYAFRPHFKLLQGTQFHAGLRQVMVGRAIARKYPELQVGSNIKLGDSVWQVSGIFSDNASAFESELWADLTTVQSDFKRGNSVQSLRIAMQPGTDINKVRQQWHADPRLNINAQWETSFFAEQGQKLTRLIRWLGYPVAIVMALGAAVAALNTMYAAIASRRKEIATYKAIGFAPGAMFFAVVCEAMMLALLGAAIGIIPLYLLFNGWTAATQNAANLSQLMFNFDITPLLLIEATLFSAGIGLLGGILPAIGALRLPVAHALRD